MLTLVERERAGLVPDDTIAAPAGTFARLVEVLDELERYVAVELAEDDFTAMDPWVADDDAIAIRALSL